MLYKSLDTCQVFTWLANKLKMSSSIECTKETVAAKCFLDSTMYDLTCKYLNKRWLWSCCLLVNKSLILSPAQSSCSELLLTVMKQRHPEQLSAHCHKTPSSHSRHWPVTEHAGTLNALLVLYLQHRLTHWMCLLGARFLASQNITKGVLLRNHHTRKSF